MAFGIVCEAAEKKNAFVVNHLNGMVGPMKDGAKMLLKKSKAQGAEGSRAQDQTRQITLSLWKVRKSVPTSSEGVCRKFCNFYVAIAKTKQLKQYISEFENP